MSSGRTVVLTLHAILQTDTRRARAQLVCFRQGIISGNGQATLGSVLSTRGSVIVAPQAWRERVRQRGSRRPPNRFSLFPLSIPGPRRSMVSPWLSLLHHCDL